MVVFKREEVGSGFFLPKRFFGSCADLPSLRPALSACGYDVD